MANTTTSGTATHPEYDDNIDVWSGIRVSCKGPKSVKDGGKKYLPDPSSHGAICNNKKACDRRYERYLENAVYYAYTKNTQKKIVGEVWGKEHKIELPSQMEPMLENIDGSGIKFNQQAKRAVGDNLALGRLGLLVEFPVNDIEVKNAASTAHLLPTLNLFTAEEMLDWSTTTDDLNETYINYIKLRYVEYEQTVDSTSGSRETECVTYIKELDLDEDGDYRITTYPEDADEETLAKARIDAVYPLDYRGAFIKRIGFEPIGSTNNDIDVDPAPFEDLAHINFKHYVNSADYEENLFYTGQSTLVAKMDAQFYKDLYKNDDKVITTGSGQAIITPEGGGAEILQMPQNTGLYQAMNRKVEAMAEIGARITQQSNVDSSATEIVVNDRGQKSAVISVVNNVSEGYEAALRYAAEHFMGLNPDEVNIRFNLDYNFKQLDAQTITAMAAIEEKGKITEREFRNMLIEDGHKIEKDYELFVEEREGQTR